MLQVVNFLVFIVFSGALAQNDCVPDPVTRIEISPNYTLSWLPSLNCDNTDYIIYVHGEFNLDHIYQIPSTNLDVSFLPVCERYRFEIVAHSQNTISQETSFETVIPVPPEGDLNVTFFNVTQIDGNPVFLQWGVDEKYLQCVHYFRVVILDRLLLPMVRDMYLNGTSLRIDTLAPCVEYEFSVRVIYNLAIEGPISVVTYETIPAPTELPVMQSIGIADTYVNLTWTLPYYAAHRCPITSVVVDGSPYYNNVFPIEDTPRRLQPTTVLGPLRSDTMYFFRIYIVNSGGNSDPFQIAVQTLP